MSRGINKVILIGNLGSDPEVRYTLAGNAIATISLATTSVRRDKNGITQEKREWHSVVLFNHRAENAGKHLHKRSKVYIEGSIQTRKWQDNEGVMRYKTEILASNIQFLDFRVKADNYINEDEELSSEDYQIIQQSDEEFFKTNSSKESTT